MNINFCPKNGLPMPLPIFPPFSFPMKSAIYTNHPIP